MDAVVSFTRLRKQTGGSPGKLKEGENLGLLYGNGEILLGRATKRHSRPKRGMGNGAQKAAIAGHDLLVKGVIGEGPYVHTARACIKRWCCAWCRVAVSRVAEGTAAVSLTVRTLGGSQTCWCRCSSAPGPPVCTLPALLHGARPTRTVRL
jgi:hypothetical protein